MLNREVSYSTRLKHAAVNALNRSVNNNFHALTNKNFRYFWIGQCVSLIGTWMQNIGQSWLVLSLTDSPKLLGLVSTIQFLPITIFSLFAGVVVDRFPKKKILLFTQTTSMLLAFSLSYLVLSHRIRYEYILFFALILGITNCLDMPTRQSFTIEVAGKDDLMNAIALNSAIFNLARILGPSIGAIFMAYFGPGWCFFFNGVSFIAVIIGLINIKTTGYVRKKQQNCSILKEIWDGLTYIKDNKVLIQTLLLVLIMGCFAFNYNVLIPVFTKNILHQQEKIYGFLMSALGLGSLIGALTASMKSKRGPKKKLLLLSTLSISIFLILTGITRNYILTAFSLFMTGIFNIFFSTTANSTLQINSSDEYRGRVMSVYSLVFAGSTPIGSLFSGTVASSSGASRAFIYSGVICLAWLLMMLFIFKKRAAARENAFKV